MSVDLGTNLVLVTGASGWLGRRLVDVLTDGLADDDRLRDVPADRTVRAIDPAPPAAEAGPGATPSACSGWTATCATRRSAGGSARGPAARC